MFGGWAATPWRSGTLCSLSTPSPPSLHGYHGNSSAQWLQHAAIRGFMITVATPADRQWVLTYPTDPYYPKLLPTKPRPIPMPHNILRFWLHPGYKKTGLPCSLGTVNLAGERTLNKACLKPACFVICLQFGLPISVNLTWPNIVQTCPRPIFVLSCKIKFYQELF
jgi:hypothetical protein